MLVDISAHMWTWFLFFSLINCLKSPLENLVGRSSGWSCVYVFAVAEHCTALSTDSCDYFLHSSKLFFYSRDAVGTCVVFYLHDTQWHAQHTRCIASSTGSHDASSSAQTTTVHGEVRHLRLPQQCIGLVDRFLRCSSRCRSADLSICITISLCTEVP